MGQVAIVIPTLRRAESLARALASLTRQDEGERLIDQVVVVDNSPEGSAREVAARFEAHVPLIYVHEPRPGVATARNAGLSRVAAPYVAFLDDDEEAPPAWLRLLLETHQRLEADVTFGPWRGVAAFAPTWKRPYLEAFFSRVGPDVSGLTDERFGCGNSMMTRATTLAGPAPFDPRYNEIGGEDDRLYQQIESRGARFAWAADAWVFEHAAPSRCRLSYAFRRAFSFGQSPATDCRHRRDWPGVAWWMLIGIAQFGVYAPAALALWLVGSKRRLFVTDRAVRGLGKVIWWVTPRFYGAAALAQGGPASPAAPAASSFELT